MKQRLTSIILTIFVLNLTMVGSAMAIVDDVSTVSSSSVASSVVRLPGCSGVLISPSWVLTITHCVDRYGDRVIPRERDVSITSGSALATFVNPSRSVSIRMDRVVRVDGEATSTNSLALLHLSNPAPSWAEPLPLYRGTELPSPGERMEIFGFGNAAGRLGGYVNIVDKIWRDPGQQFWALCLKADPSSIERGDSGGPVLITLHGRKEVIGINWNLGCEDCQDASPCGGRAAAAFNINESGHSNPAGSLIYRILHNYDWSSGWTTAKFFFGDPPSKFLFLLKESNGDVHVNRMNDDGTVGNLVFDADWSRGWTTAQFAYLQSRLFLLVLKGSTGEVHIHRMNGDGTVGDRVFNADWSSGWTTARFFHGFSGEPYDEFPEVLDYLFLLKESNGYVHIHRMNSNGTVGVEVERHDWSRGWTTAEFFTMRSQTYLFLLKESTGEVHIHRMNNNGTVGDLVFEADWSRGWTTAEFFGSDTRKFLFLLKESTGEVHIHRMTDVGGRAAVGDLVFEADWSRGWTTANIAPLSTLDTFLLLLKESTGEVHIHRVNSGGTVLP